MRLSKWMLMAVGLAVAGGAFAQSRPLGLAPQLTYSFNLDGAPSPDGKALVFIKVIEGREQLFVMDAAGRNERQLTHGPIDHEDPVWSPDGRRIAFVRIEGTSKRIATIDPAGGGLDLLSPATQSAIHPNWAPDGRSLLYCTDDDLRPPVKNASQIYSIDVATRQIRTVIAGGVNTYPVWSPDGRRIVYRKIVGDMNSEVFVADADGSNPRNLTNHPAFEGWPAWSPDGRHIAFAGNRNSAYQIFVMDADGANVRLVANTEGRGTAPRWSPDGRKIYFTNCQAKDFGRGCEILVAEFTA